MTAPPPLLRHAWLLAGAVLSLFAMQAAGDIALLAWVYPVLLLRFARASRPLPAVLGVLAATTAAVLRARFGSVNDELLASTAREAAAGAEAVVRPESAAFTLEEDRDLLARTDYFATGQQTLVAMVPREGVTTVYSRIGDAFAWSCVAALAALAVLSIAPPRRE